MSIIYSKERTHKGKDGVQCKLIPKGDEFLSWFEDTLGNPIIDVDGVLYYATWDSDLQTFVPCESLAEKTRKKRMKRNYSKPTKKEYAKLRERPLQKAEASLDSNGMFTLTKPILNSSFMTLPIAPDSSASGTVARPIVVIYLKYQDSASFPATALTDNQLTQMFFDKGTFGTLAHYYDVQFSGTVEIKNEGLYKVTLPRNSTGTRTITVNGTTKTVWAEDYSFEAAGSSADYLNSDVIAPALNGIATQGFDFSKYVHAGTSFDWSTIFTISAGGEPVSPTYQPQIIDRTTLTPVIIMHGAENACYALGKSAVGTANPVGIPRVHGQAATSGVSFAVKTDGTVADLQTVINDVLDYVNKQTTGTDTVARLNEGFQRWPYVIQNWAIFGAYQNDGVDTHMFTLGIVAHECGHSLFDLPDLYDISTPDRTGNSSDDEINGFGLWSLMAYNWSQANANQRSGAVPPNLDGYCIQLFNKNLATSIFKSGSYTIDDPFHPHNIKMKDIDEEAFILQSRCFTGYDACIPYTAPLLKSGLGEFKPGVLVMHYNPGGSNKYGNISASDMLCRIEEAHGGTQNLQVDRSNSDSNFADPGDVFRQSVNDAFGDSISSPDNVLITENAGNKGGFDITNIVGNDDCTASYDISYTDGEPEPEPEDPDNPPGEDTPANPPIVLKAECDRPRLWRLRKARYTNTETVNV